MCDVLIHTEVSSMSGNSMPTQPLSLVHDTVQKHNHKCSYLSIFIVGCWIVPPYSVYKFDITLQNE